MPGFELMFLYIKSYYLNRNATLACDYEDNLMYLNKIKVNFLISNPTGRSREIPIDLSLTT